MISNFGSSNLAPATTYCSFYQNISTNREPSNIFARDSVDHAQLVIELVTNTQLISDFLYENVTLNFGPFSMSTLC